ncbi:MAG TPA: hypothetical protein PKC14_04720 [Candidatus Absconditabacterales bacterium]|nr:hypothetical protein [Candidatus Absconditabacterales bacterium]
MTTTHLLAQIWGLCFVIIGVSLLIQKDYYQKSFETILKGSTGALALYGSAFNLILGLWLVSIHNLRSNRGEILVSLVGRSALAKGLALAFFPQQVFAFRAKPKMLASKLLRGAVVGLVRGFALCYYAYSLSMAL